MKIGAVNFPYSTKVVSEKQFEEHLKLYKGYIDKTNSISSSLETEKAIRSDANKTYSIYRGLKKGQTFALDGVILHEEYFKNISGSESSPGETFTALTKKYFGSFENWVEDFVACAKSARGWCMTAYEQRTKTLCNILLDSHDEGNICLAFPIVILDMYEHAYFLDYGTDSTAYIRKFIESLNWNVIETRSKILGDLY